MKLTRRTFLASGTAAMAGTLVSAAQASVPKNWDMIIIGAGTAGLPAAYFAAKRGLKVLVIEKQGTNGGTLWFTGASLSASGTRRQRELGIVDTPEDHFNDVMRLSRRTADPDMVRLAVEQAGPTLDWLEDSGYQFDARFPLDTVGHEYYSARRVWGGRDRGQGILRVVEGQIEKLPKKPFVLNNFAVTELLVDARGNVIGVKAEDDIGASREFRAPSVIMTSGGYQASADMFARMMGFPLPRAGWNWANTGIGIDLALSIGGWVRGKENYICSFGTILGDKKLPANEYARIVHDYEMRKPWEIWVNSSGNRFIREDEPSIDSKEYALLAQNCHRYWTIFDQAILEQSSGLVKSAPPAPVQAWTREELLEAFNNHPCFIKADSLPELAQKTGIAGDGLIETIARYNQVVRGEINDSLGRKYCPRQIAKGPFYAILHQGSSQTSAVGVGVDKNLRVTRKDGSLIKGLYAAGEVLGTGALSGKSFCGGMSVTPALSLGRWLGMTVSSR